MSDKVYLAIYGSLLSGCCRESAIKKVYSRRKCKIPGMLLTSFHLDWPVLVPREESSLNTEVVVGEVLQIDRKNLLGSIDMMEGYPTVCTRSIMKVTLDDGSTVDAYVYYPSDETMKTLYNSPAYNLKPVIQNDWRLHLKLLKAATRGGLFGD
jgi:gamma-glutamylcyclotransferase (GGCT)/AIG2-like uncharacterized protein YtfP